MFVAFFFLFSFSYHTIPINWLGAVDQQQLSNWYGKVNRITTFRRDLREGDHLACKILRAKFREVEVKEASSDWAEVNEVREQQLWEQREHGPRERESNLLGSSLGWAGVWAFLSVRPWQNPPAITSLYSSVVLFCKI